MSNRGGLDQLSIFLRVAEFRSFSKAARALGLTTSAISQSIRQMEERVGMPLFYRTTRNVTLTEAGQHLYERVRPATEEIEQAFDQVRFLSETPAGTLRLNICSPAVHPLIGPVIAEFLAENPEVKLEITVDNRMRNIIADGYDAGIRLGESVDPDMISVTLMPEVKSVIVASPEYLAKHGTPKTIEDLAQHNCIRFRSNPEEEPYRWHMRQGERETQIRVDGNFITNDGDLKVRAVLDGVGVLYSIDFFLRDHLKSGELVQIMEEFSVVEEGLCLYFPMRAQQSPKLRAFVDLMKKRRSIVQKQYADMMPRLSA